MNKVGKDGRNLAGCNVELGFCTQHVWVLMWRLHCVVHHQFRNGRRSYFHRLM